MQCELKSSHVHCQLADSLIFLLLYNDRIYTVSQKNTYDYMFNNNLNTDCPITIIFGIRVLITCNCFYRAMLYAEHGIATTSRLSVRDVEVS